jgi:DNA-binding transcriptional LysR family regulator
MNAEKLAIFGIVIFGFMALVQAWRTARQASHMMKRREGGRPRRLISSEPAAAELARALIDEVVKKNPELVLKTKEAGVMDSVLDRQIKTAMNHYLDRVSPKFRGLFHATVSNVIFQRKEKPDEVS